MVVLITQPREGGPFGVIINKPLEHRLAKVMPDQLKLKDTKDVVHFGGPVEPQGLTVLLRADKAPANSVRMLKDVYFITDPDAIDALLQRANPTRGLRVYAGHAGWAPGQLQRELERGAWHVLPADAATVFETPYKLIWPQLIKRATTKHTRGGGTGEFPSVYAGSPL